MPDSKEKFPLRFLVGAYAVHRLHSGAKPPRTPGDGEFHCVIRTPTDITVICPADHKVDAEQSSGPWSLLQVVGPLEHSLTGVLAGITRHLAEAGIPIFSISSWDTDYLLVSTDRAPAARATLEDAGYVFPA